MSVSKNLYVSPAKNNNSQEVLPKKIKVHLNHLVRYHHNLTASSMELVQDFANMLDNSIDQHLYSW